MIETSNEICESARWRALYYEIWQAVHLFVQRKSQTTDEEEKDEQKEREREREQTGYEILRLEAPSSPFFGAIIGPFTKQFPSGREGTGRKAVRGDRDVNPMFLRTSRGRGLRVRSSGVIPALN